MNVPFLSFEPQHAPLRETRQTAFARVYDSHSYVLVKEVQQFEQDYAVFGWVGHAVGVANDLDALVPALRALVIGLGDEVIVPSNTYNATCLAVMQVGATPVSVQPDPATSNLDPARIEAALTPRTRAIMPVHLYGQAGRMTEIMAIATRRGLYVVEDNAQVQGAAFAEQPTGSSGHVNGTSFYPGKNLGALGDAGANTTNNAALVQQVRALRNYGSRQKYHNEVVGYNSRFDELQAPLLRVKLPESCQQVAAWYNQQQAGIAGLLLPAVAAGATHVYHLYVVHTPQRAVLQQHLTAQGIGYAHSLSRAAPPPAGLRRPEYARGPISHCRRVGRYLPEPAPVAGHDGGPRSGRGGRNPNFFKV